MDRYLARIAYEGQFSDFEYDPDRPDNLFDPVESDPGAHGPFDQTAVRSSQQLWLSKHRRHLGVALLMLTLLCAWLGWNGNDE